MKQRKDWQSPLLKTYIVYGVALPDTACVPVCVESVADID